MGIDVRPGWIAGADALFGRLIDAVPWRAELRQMYDRVVDVPRLLCFYGDGDRCPAGLDRRRRRAVRPADRRGAVARRAAADVRPGGRRAAAAVLLRRGPAAARPGARGGPAGAGYALCRRAG